MHILLKPILKSLENLEKGTMTLIMPEGKMFKFTGKQQGEDGILIVHNSNLFNRFLTRGMLGFCEGYINAECSSPNLGAFLKVFLDNEDVFKGKMYGQNWQRALGFIQKMFNGNSKTGSKRNISRHYDLGNAFYKAWLDPSMTYSSAVFDGQNADLTTAQMRKFELLAQRLDIQPHHQVLEIGCGWGGFAEYVAREIGAHVTAITISEEQFAYATQRIIDAGLTDKVNIRFQDYRDLDGKFDRVASIEMFEAVGEQYWPIFFKTLQKVTKPDGRIGLQIITISHERFLKYRTSMDFIQKYVFPGGMLPSVKALKGQARLAGLRWHETFAFGQDYAETLRRWTDTFQTQWPAIKPMGYDDRFKRIWEQYLHYCMAGFRAGTIDVIQFTLSPRSA